MNEKMLYRDFRILDNTIKEDDRTVELSFSSEDPYLRYFGYEILGHGDDEIRLDRLMKTGPLLLDHNHSKQIGKVESVMVEKGKGIAVVRFSRSSLGEEIFQDVIDEIRENVSVGYQLHELHLLEMKGEEDVDMYRAVDWEPHEISIVSVPADTTVGIGRSIDDLENVKIITKNEKETETCQMKKKLKLKINLTT